MEDEFQELMQMLIQNKSLEVVEVQFDFFDEAYVRMAMTMLEQRVPPLKSFVMKGVVTEMEHLIKNCVAENLLRR